MHGAYAILATKKREMARIDPSFMHEYRTNKIEMNVIYSTKNLPIFKMTTPPKKDVFTTIRGLCTEN